jgi:hypothetical protein
MPNIILLSHAKANDGKLHLRVRIKQASKTPRRSQESIRTAIGSNEHSWRWLHGEKMRDWQREELAQMWRSIQKAARERAHKNGSLYKGLPK